LHFFSHTTPPPQTYTLSLHDALPISALAVPAFQRFKRRAAHLRVIDGAAIICHGASPVKAIKNAVRVARDWAKAGVNEHIKAARSEEHTSELQSRGHLVCRLLLEKKT